MAVRGVFIVSKQKIIFKGRKILLAEDNSLSAEIAKMILEEEGICVDCVGNGKRAVDIFNRAVPYYYDAVILDIRMPVMDGWEAARNIRALEKNGSGQVPIIAMTADTSEEDIMKSRENGMNEHIAKPIERKRLFDVLEKLLKNGAGRQA